jgi:hypothetical protein
MDSTCRCVRILRCLFLLSPQHAVPSNKRPSCIPLSPSIVPGASPAFGSEHGRGPQHAACVRCHPVLQHGRLVLLYSRGQPAPPDDDAPDCVPHSRRVPVGHCQRAHLQQLLVGRRRHGSRALPTSAQRHVPVRGGLPQQRQCTHHLQYHSGIRQPSSDHQRTLLQLAVPGGQQRVVHIIHQDCICGTVLLHMVVVGGEWCLPSS